MATFKNITQRNTLKSKLYKVFSTSTIKTLTNQER